MKTKISLAAAIPLFLLSACSPDNYGPGDRDDIPTGFDPEVVDDLIQNEITQIPYGPFRPNRPIVSPLQEEVFADLAAFYNSAPRFYVAWVSPPGSRSILKVVPYAIDRRPGGFQAIPLTALQAPDRLGLWRSYLYSDVFSLDPTAETLVVAYDNPRGYGIETYDVSNGTSEFFPDPGTDAITLAENCGAPVSRQSIENYFGVELGDGELEYEGLRDSSRYWGGMNRDGTVFVYFRGGWRVSLDGESLGNFITTDGFRLNLDLSDLGDSSLAVCDVGPEVAFVPPDFEITYEDGQVLADGQPVSRFRQPGVPFDLNDSAPGPSAYVHRVTDAFIRR